MRVIVVAIAAAALSVGLAPVGQAGTACKKVTYTHHQSSLLHTSTMFEMHLQVQACRSNGHITTVSAVCWIDNVDWLTVQHSNCNVQEGRYEWNGNWDGGYVAIASGTFSNCLFKYGCLTQGTLTMFVYATANGAISTRKET